MMAVWVWKGWHEGKEGLPLGIVGEALPVVGGVHVVSFVFLAWGCAMVSKSLKVPKL
jgi:CDP-diacylglycerol---serine O-phosphatidyltransferase